MKNKEIYSDEANRNDYLARIASLQAKIEALADEKMAITARLFSTQENFIRKLD